MLWEAFVIEKCYRFVHSLVKFKNNSTERCWYCIGKIFLSGSKKKDGLNQELQTQIDRFPTLWGHI